MLAHFDSILNIGNGMGNGHQVCTPTLCPLCRRSLHAACSNQFEAGQFDDADDDDDSPGPGARSPGAGS
jgi:hypothetical protein